MTHQGNTQQKRDQLESLFGCCCSSLLKLSYFDLIQMLAIEPMHDLFLGTAKKMLEIWQDQGFLRRHHFEQIHGCSKCFKEFPGKPGQMDYSGFERSLWPKRTIQEHCQNAQLTHQGNTQQKRDQFESLFGCCYSSLL